MTIKTSNSVILDPFYLSPASEAAEFEWFLYVSYRDKTSKKTLCYYFLSVFYCFSVKNIFFIA